MATATNPAWAELVQLVPIVSLAFPIVAAGKVDLSRAGSGFLVGALLTIPVSALIVWRHHLLNPILVGANLWLWFGVIAFDLPVSRLADWLSGTQAFGLFVCVLVVGLGVTIFSAQGYVACRSGDARWIRRSSLGLLGLTVFMVGWAWLFRHDIRLGGGLPFIALNAARRLLGRRAPVTAPRLLSIG